MRTMPSTVKTLQKNGFPFYPVEVRVLSDRSPECLPTWARRLKPLTISASGKVKMDCQFKVSKTTTASFTLIIRLLGLCSSRRVPSMMKRWSVWGRSSSIITNSRLPSCHVWNQEQWVKFHRMHLETNISGSCAGALMLASVSDTVNYCSAYSGLYPTNYSLIYSRQMNLNSYGYFEHVF